MSLLSYAVYYNPTSHKDVLSKFRAFALARGWTIDKYETSKDWLWDSGNSKYDWLAGTSDFLQIYSNGYGSQTLVFRFHFEGTGADGQSEWCYVTGINPSNRTPDDQSSVVPRIQNTYNGTRMRYHSLPSGTDVALWLFGNDKFLIAVDQVASNVVLIWYVGTFELFQSTMATVAMARATYANTGASGISKWYEAETYPSFFVSPWDNWGVNLSYYSHGWWDGLVVNGDSLRPNIAFAGDGVKTWLAFNEVAHAVRANNFTGKRTLIKQVYFGQRQSDGLWMPIGTAPFYRIEFAGLQIGENIKYGSEEYLVFPNTFSNSKYGNAFRIV